jgi:uncharacterized protein (DUF2336 family)
MVKIGAAKRAAISSKNRALATVSKVLVGCGDEAMVGVVTADLST